MSEVITKELSKQAESLLNMMSRGIINLPELKNFLVRVESIRKVQPRRKKREEALAEMKAQLIKRKK